MRKSYLWLEQVFENRLVALVLAATVIVPLVATPADSSLRGIAAFAFEFLGVLLLAALLWRGRLNLSRENVAQFLRTGANLPILLFLGVVAVSTAMSSHRDVSAQELLRTGVGVLLYFVVAYQFRRVHHLAKLVDTLLYLAIVSALIGFAHYASSSTEREATGQFGDHQLFGSFLMLLLPILVVTAVTESRRNRQLAAQVATVLTGTCLLLAQARGAWLGSLTALITMILLGAVNNKQRTKWTANKHEWILPIMLVVASLGFFLTIAPWSHKVTERATTLTTGSAGSEYSIADREARWSGTAKMIQEHPWGVGPGLYPYQQYDYTHVGNKLQFGSHRNSLNDQAHNLYLQTAAELGIPGLLLLLAMIVTFFITGAQQVQRMHRDFRRNVLIGTLGSVIGFAVDAIFSPSWQFGHITMFLWLTMGMGVSCMLSSPQEEPATAKAAPARGRAVAVPICLAMSTILPTSMLSAQPLYLPPPVIMATGHNDTGVIVAGSIGAAAVVAGILTNRRGSGGGGGTAANVHLLQPGDVIDIIVGGHKDLSKTVKISDDGKIPYRAASLDTDSNGIQAAGMTPNELGTSLQKALLEFSKINQNDQVVVRLNKAYLEHQATHHMRNLDDQNVITQNASGMKINANGEQSNTTDGAPTHDADAAHTDSLAPADTDANKAE